MRKSAQSLIVGCVVMALGALVPDKSEAGPSADVAKKCMRFSYIAFPYKRPGSVRMSGDRQSYFRDCMARDGQVPDPSPPKN